MAKSQSIRKPANGKLHKIGPAERLPKRPIISLTAQATEKYPLANPNPKGHLSMIIDDIRKQSENLEHVYELMGMAEGNPTIADSGFFLSSIIEQLQKDAGYLEDINNTLHVKTA